RLVPDQLRVSAARDDRGIDATLRRNGRTEVSLVLADLSSPIPTVRPIAGTVSPGARHPACRGGVIMTTRRIGGVAVAGAGALALCCASIEPVSGQTPGGFPNVVNALKTSPGVLGVETGQTASGRRVIFAWFDGKKSLVEWYHSDVHQRAMRAVYPNGTFGREPLPDLPDDTGPILTIVSVKFADAPQPR